MHLAPVADLAAVVNDFCGAGYFDGAVGHPSGCLQPAICDAWAGAQGLCPHQALDAVQAAMLTARQNIPPDPVCTIGPIAIQEAALSELCQMLVFQAVPAPPPLPAERSVISGTAISDYRYPHLIGLAGHDRYRRVADTELQSSDHRSTTWRS